MLKEFKEFLVRGNLVALAVAFVIGAAFAALVTAFVADLITPIIAAIGGQPDFSSLDFTINDSTFRYGDFLNALITFVIIAAVIFFFVVRPYDKLLKRMRQGEDEAAPPQAEYAVETLGGPGDVAPLLNQRAGDGWRMVSMDGVDGGGVTVVLEKAP